MSRERLRKHRAKIKEAHTKLQNKKFFKVIIVLILLFIPLIYSFFYLKSYWDPYGNLKDMQVALVNLDEGYQGENEGKTFIDGIIDTGAMNFIPASEQEAKTGLEGDTYFAVITVPKDFTKCLKSAGEKEKHITTITYSPNKKKNYLASQIINSVINKVEIKLQSKISKEVVSTLSGAVAEVPNSLQKIKDGSTQIYDGTEALNSGLTDLSNGVGTLNSKYDAFDAGVQSAHNGSKSLSAGISEVNSGIDELSDGADQLDNALSTINENAAEINGEKIQTLANGISQVNTGAVDLKSGIVEYTQGSSSLNTNLQEYTTGVKNYVAGVQTLDASQNELLNSIIALDTATNGSNTQIHQLATSAKQILQAKTANRLTENGTKLSGVSTQIATGSKELVSNNENLTAGANKLVAGTNLLNNNTKDISKLAEGIGKLQDALGKVQQGTSALEGGINLLSAGGTQVENGANQLEAGLKTLADNSGNVKNALTQLDEGSKKAKDGSEQLLEGVTTFNEKIDEGIETANTEISKLDGLDNFVEDPVVIEEKSYGNVSSYGVAFTPLFLCIGLWVGAYVMYIVLYYDQRHRFGKLDYNYKNKFLQNFLYLAIGAADGILTGLLIKFGLNIDVSNMALYLAECSLLGVAFMAIVQFLIRNLGDIGKFLVLIILVLQLAASGGTFPVETIFKGFRFLNPLLPMTYGINIFREVLIPTDVNAIGRNTLIIAIITIALIAINLVIEITKNKLRKIDEQA